MYEFPVAAEAHRVPELLGDERHERVQQKQCLAQAQILYGERRSLGAFVRHAGFGDFEVPAAEIVPEECVKLLGYGVELVGFVVPRDVF